MTFLSNKRVRFSRRNTVHEIPNLKTPSPCDSLPSLPSTGGPATPPDLPNVLPPHHSRYVPKRSRTYYPPPPPPSQLHPTLAGPRPAIRYNVLDSPSHLALLSRNISPHYHSEPATFPAVGYMVITSPVLPWKIEVRPSHHGAPVTVADVLYAIRDTLRGNIHASDYDRLSSSEKKYIKRTYEARYHAYRSGSRDYEATKSQGIKKSDWLLGKTMFMGLASTGNPTVYTLYTA